MLFQTRSKVANFSRSRRFTSGDGDVDGRQSVLVQAKRLARQALDAITRHGRAKRTRRDTQAKTRVRVGVDQHRYAEKHVGESPAAALHVAKFSRLMQTLARLERQFTDRSSSRRELRTEALAALGASTRQQSAAALGGHARAKSMSTSTVQIAGIESTFHSATRAKTAGQINGPGRFTRAGKGTDGAWMCQ